jgi:hypothetical protein
MIKQPTTLEDAVEILVSYLEQNDLEYIDNSKCEDVSAELHHSMGRFLRNNWGLWGTNEFTTHMRSLGIFHADDISATVIEALWHHRHDKVFDIEAKKAEYEAHWKMMKERSKK